MGSRDGRGVLRPARVLPAELTCTADRASGVAQRAAALCAPLARSNAEGGEPQCRRCVGVVAATFRSPRRADGGGAPKRTPATGTYTAFRSRDGYPSWLSTGVNL